MVELDQFKAIMNAYEEPLARNEGFTLTLQAKKERIEELERKIEEPGFWDKPEESQRIMKELRRICRNCVKADP